METVNDAHHLQGVWKALNNAQICNVFKAFEEYETNISKKRYFAKLSQFFYIKIHFFIN